MPELNNNKATAHSPVTIDYTSEDITNYVISVAETTLSLTPNSTQLVEEAGVSKPATEMDSLATVHPPQAPSTSSLVLPRELQRNSPVEEPELSQQQP